MDFSSSFHESQQIQMEEIINDGVTRSNALYNLSEADRFNSNSEIESDESDSDYNVEDSDSTSNSDGEEENIQTNDPTNMDGHIPNVPWFTTEEILNNVAMNNSGHFPNFNSLNNDLFEGQCFVDKQTAIDAIKSSHIRESRNYHVLKSTTVLYEAKCTIVTCPWKIRVIKSKRSGYFQITKLPAQHNCLLRTIQRDHKKLSSKMIGSVIKQQIMEGPYLKVNNIRNQILAMYKYHVSYKKAWLAKQKAISEVYGDWTISYSKLPKFLSALMHFNPGTSVSIEAVVDVTKLHTSVFKRVWWAFKPIADGWQHARPVISIDGTFLKGRYNGKLLIAMGSDSNNHQYPLAYAIVNEETTANWSWFLRRLRRFICRSRTGVCIISDRHAGIIEAMKKEQNGFTGDMGIHRFCLYHVRSNFSSAYPGSHLKMLCWVAGNNSQVRKFEDAMRQIKELNPDAEKWLRNIPLEMWTMSHDGGYRYGQATTNMVEGFNGILRSARFLPITSMVEYIYYRSVKLVAERRTQTLNDLQNGHTYCNMSRKLFENIESKASAHTVIPYNEQTGIFEVTTARYRTNNGCWKGGNKHIIDLCKGFCSCGKWCRYHSPCSHIVAGCIVCNLDWVKYIDTYHNLTTLSEMWQYDFHPIPNESYWTFPIAHDWEKYGNLVPNENSRKKKNQRGQSQRIRTEMDNPRRTIICGKCGQEGHTRRSQRCPEQNRQ
ncbi:uncharacterized protein LOC124917311 [Impatiens glandulifera]|uniref:uncharacterized protein LOC124917311 n=1 Tax=Impatiens glandulifera TaxID=253017 RepID=UPI001FB07917|nr:uncharacterized protein LOC124917311 [Impatiens glandulifera]